MAATGIFMVDCSVSIAWLFDEQADDYTEAAVSALVGTYTVAPRWLNVEVLNVLLVLERKKRLAAGKAVDLARHMLRLPVRFQESQASVFDFMPSPSGTI